MRNRNHLQAQITLPPDVLRAGRDLAKRNDVPFSVLVGLLLKQAHDGDVRIVSRPTSDFATNP